MSHGYTKLFGSILYSSIWQAPDGVRILWITMLALKDRDGVVEASVPGLAKIAGLSIDVTVSALATLMDPDPYSRTTDHEGRRIETCEGGWRVINHDKYQYRSTPEEFRAKEAARKARYRARISSRSRPVPGTVPDVPPCPSMSLHSDSDSDSDKEGGDRARDPTVPGTGTAPGKTDPPPPIFGNGKAEAAAGRVLARLTAENGVAYTSPDHAQLVVDRIREGVTEAELRAVVVYAVHDLGWRDARMRANLSPQTLFGSRGKLARYLDAARSKYRREIAAMSTEDK